MKYGRFRPPEESISSGRTRRPDRRLAFASHGPKAEALSFGTCAGSKGFGSRLIERMLANDFAGKVQISYRPDGVVCELIAPLSSCGPLAAE
jgi:hypothetical protein